MMPSDHHVSIEVAQNVCQLLAGGRVEAGEGVIEKHQRRIQD